MHCANNWKIPSGQSELNTGVYGREGDSLQRSASVISHCGPLSLHQGQAPRSMLDTLPAHPIVLDQRGHDRRGKCTRRDGLLGQLRMGALDRSGVFFRESGARGKKANISVRRCGCLWLTLHVSLADPLFSPIPLQNASYMPCRRRPTFSGMPRYLTHEPPNSPLALKVNASLWDIER